VLFTNITVEFIGNIQSSQMRKYSKLYGDFTIVDGTHNTTAYDLKLMPYTNVDALGKNIISAVLLDLSENTSTIMEGLQVFQLAQLGATLMTDGGSAYPEAAASCGMV